MASFFIKIYHSIKAHYRFSVLFFLCLFVVVAFFASKITFEEDITKIIPKSEQGNITTKVVQQLKFSDKITVLISREDKGSLDDLTQTARLFLDKLACCNQYIKNVQGRVDEKNIKQTFDFVYTHLPLFLDDSDYLKIEQKLARDSINVQVEQNFKTLLSPTGIIAKDFIVADPLGVSFVALKKLQELSISDNFKLIDGYIVTKDEQSLLLFIDPVLSGSETEKNTNFIEELNKLKHEINTQLLGKSTIDYFGASFIAVANAKQIKTDILTTVIISISVLILLLMLYYRKVYVPVIIFIPSVFGGLFALMCLYFFKDSISAISISIGAVLLGITVDYSLHILTHYKNNADISLLYKDITRPLIMSSITTAVAFLCLFFVKSEALQDLGLFASIAVVMSALFSIVIIPHLYKVSNTTGQPRKTMLDKIASFSFEKNKVLLIGSLLLIIGSFFTYKNVSFDNDLSKLNYIPAEIKQVEKKLENSTNLTSKSLYVVAYGEDKEQVLQRNEELKENLEEFKLAEKIIDFNSLSNIVLSNKEQLKRIKKWNEFWDENKVNKFKQNIINAGKPLGFKAETHQKFFTLLTTQQQPVKLKEYAEIPAFFTEEFISEKNGFYTITSVVKVDDAKRAAAIKQIEAKQNNLLVIDRKQLNETYLGHLKDDFNRLINYSFIAIVLILWYFFRRIELVLISLIPILLTGFIIMGVMGLLNIQLNIFSSIVATLIFGHGIDFTIFMTNALQKEHTYGKNELPTYRTSILLAVITTILAIGALVFAAHPALKSISVLSLIGVFSALVITFVFYPIVFKLCITNRTKHHKSPITLRLFLHSFFSFLYYGGGSIILSVIGRFFVKILPGNEERKMRFLRKLMSKFLTSVLYFNPFVKKEILNPNREDFSNPAVIISNHTSFLDSLTLSMVSANIIFLVNDWVYNSPVFGKIVKMAGFYPVSQGVDGSVEHLREKVKQGYSLMVFPEGTRSEDNTIKRFHKGAFYLAEQFELDILPIYVHGNSEVLPRNDYIIYDGSMTVKTGDRISPSNTNFGNTYSERTKKINRYFRAEFDELRKQIEDENYFKKKLFLAYLYKESAVIKAVKTSVKKYKLTYLALATLIESKATIYHIADNYGEIDLLLTWQYPTRKISTYIKDAEKRAVAKNNYPVGRSNISYKETFGIDENIHTLLISAELAVKIVIPSAVKEVILIEKANSAAIENLNEFTAFINQNGIRGFRRNE
ncbi:hypothetical protein GGR32_000266 [Mesonia hippocampi]|uniref:SSD domain-containing protein n=1 Tax=Mesonia hippocampi TaxID=1628250 RepID=A0A840EV81_9FLAO|nr:1-acyl-sn-glycerol-3-phosphate acyltransferase [Mesonia hippocampi]MBB4117994.1 hypothetical protein [Mesonia hippocampi]